MKRTLSNVIVMKELYDQTDGKKVYYSELVLNNRNLIAFNMREPHKEREAYIFSAYPFATPYKDKRIPLLKITHSSDYESGTSPLKSHELEFVLDPENHNKKFPFHINCSGLSEQYIKGDECPTCKKYFFGLNHFPFSYVEYDEGKFSDLNKTLDKFFERLRQAGFFDVYKYQINLQPPSQ